MGRIERLEEKYDNDLSALASSMQYLEAHMHVLERVQSDILRGVPIHTQTNGEDEWVDYQAYFAEYFACQAFSDLARLIERPSEEYGGATVWGN